MNILLVDDHDAVIEGVTMRLKTELKFECTFFTALSPAEAKQITAQNQIDAAVVDISFREINNTAGIDLCGYFTANTQIKVISFTSFYQVNNLRRLLIAGVHGVVAKNDGGKALAVAVTEVAKNNLYYSQSVLREFPDLIETHRKITETTRKLSARQKEIIELIAEAKKNTEIAKILNITEKGVEGHISNIAIAFGLERANRVAILKILGRIV